jgi:hypothetical protein
MRSNRRVSTTFCSLLVVSFGAFLATSSATAVTPNSLSLDASSASQVADSTGENRPNVDMSNFNLVKTLDSAGQCFYNNSVFPNGGTGFANSSLPYEGLTELDRAFAVFRAELLRAYGAEVAGVDPLVDETHAITGAVVNVTPESVVAATTLDKLAPTVSIEFTKALASLVDLGIQVTVVPKAVQGFISACPIQGLIANGELWKSAGLPSDITATTVTNSETGQLEISVGKEFVAQLENSVAPYGDQVVVKELFGSIEFQGRGHSYTPRYGGSSIYSVAYNESCSNGFRIGGNTLSTAGHCPNTSWVSPYSSTPAGSTSATYSQWPIADINILFGQTYSNRIWVGSNIGTSLMSGVGSVSSASVPTNGTGSYIFVGGTSSAQGTVKITDKDLCLTIEGTYLCNLYRATSTDAICYAGDSGTAWALYDPAGNLPALGSHSAGGALYGSTRQCYATMMDKALYNYGRSIY